MSSESFSPTKGSFSPSKNSRSRLASESSPRKERKYNSVSAIGNGQQGSTLPTSQMNKINANVSGRSSKMSTMSQGMKRNKSSANSLVPCTGPGQMDDYIKYVKEGDKLHFIPQYLQVNLCQKFFFLQNMGRICCVQKLF